MGQKITCDCHDHYFELWCAVCARVYIPRTCAVGYDVDYLIYNYNSISNDKHYNRQEFPSTNIEYPGYLK